MGTSKIIGDADSQIASDWPETQLTDFTQYNRVKRKMLKVGQRKNCVYRNDNHIEIKLYRFNYENIALPTWRR